MNKDAPKKRPTAIDGHGTPLPEAYDPTDDDVVDLRGEEGPHDLPLRLECTKCHGGNDEAPGGALTIPVRKRDDPTSIVRCATCGKKHSDNSLTVVTS